MHESANKKQDRGEPCLYRTPLILGDKTYKQVSDDICRPVEGKANKYWWLAITVSSIAMLWGITCIMYTIGTGIGVWGLNKTVDWAWDITNFVWWIGIGHAGTLISAILLLFRQRWRMSINRSAEAMTIFAVICAGLFPLIHMGRVWVGYWVFPLPNQYGSLWVNFNSPLLWDVFAISTYFSVSLVFWYLGLIPDLATIRDRAIKTSPSQPPLRGGVSTHRLWLVRWKSPSLWEGFRMGFSRSFIYNMLSFGWKGTARDWSRYEEVSLVLAGLSAPLVLSVHTIVSFDFATSLVPGWHTTIFPPYFVAGAIFSGFAMVLTLLLITRKVLNLEDYITVEHIEAMNKIIIVTGSLILTSFSFIALPLPVWWTPLYKEGLGVC